MSTYGYVGSELDLFAAATNWKRYVRRRVVRYLGNRVLEVGAGLGGSTQVLAGSGHGLWLCVEPDASLAARLRESIDGRVLPGCCEVRVGTISNVQPDERFHTILYMDVLEHIDDDAAEVSRAASHLLPGGHLVILCPAHQGLFTPFDEAVGHYRRYDKRRFRALTPAVLRLVRLEYLDSVGLLASLANRCFLKQSLPTEQQIAVWDKLMVPISRYMDPLTCHCLGKSVLGVWQRSSD